MPRTVPRGGQLFWLGTRSKGGTTRSIFAENAALFSLANSAHRKMKAIFCSCPLTPPIFMQPQSTTRHDTPTKPEKVTDSPFQSGEVAPPLGRQNEYNAEHWGTKSYPSSAPSEGRQACTGGTMILIPVGSRAASLK